MLAGVSHDLRTPLTRMKLQLEMAKGSNDTEDLKRDIVEMEHMLEGYLAFARGEGDELPKPTNISSMLSDIVMSAQRKEYGKLIYTQRGDIIVPVRPNAFKRCVTNLIDNADRYATHVYVRAGKRGDAIDVTIDDNGPGIPPDKWDDVFKPFSASTSLETRDGGSRPWPNHRPGCYPWSWR